jgi:putative spermidine/putrescine transport system substrate-binding protein
MQSRSNLFCFAIALLVAWSWAAFVGSGAPAEATEPLVVSTWGGNWRDTVDNVIGKRFTKATGIPVEYEVGGTIKRLSNAKVNKGNPLVDITLTTTHVGRLYISGGLFEKLDLNKIPNIQKAFKEAVRSPYHIGLWSYVYTIAYLPDKTPFALTKWADLWDSRLKNKIAMPDFDPSHVITVSALLSGGNEFEWKKGLPRLLEMKPNIAAFFKTDAQSQDLLKSGEAPVQIMLSVNAYKVGSERIKVKIINPTDVGGIVGIDTVGIMTGTKKLEAAYRFLNIALSQEVQEDLVRTLKVGPMHAQVSVPPELKGQPGIMSSPAEWKEHAYVLDDEQRAKALPEWKEWFNANMTQ